MRTARLQHARHRHGFTMLELLVVIGIILVLLGLLIPVVGVVRKRAQTASTKSLLMQIAGAIQMYQTDFGSFPGPLSNAQISADNLVNPTPPPATLPPPTLFLADGTTAFPRPGRITGAENLVLGLMGGLKHNGTDIIYDDTVTTGAQGPVSLNPAQPKSYQSYLSGVALTADPTGRYSDESGTADDTIIPEILDSYGNPMPILYLRANKGATGVASAGSNDAQYEIGQVIAYTGAYSGTPPDALALEPGASPTFNPPMTARSIGVGKSLPDYFADNTLLDDNTYLPYHGLRNVEGNTRTLGTPAGSTYFLPYGGAVYLENPSIAGEARQKDGYILISAGEDRVYGTDDDITNFGSVSP